MKWKNKGHEYDELVDRWQTKWGNDLKLYVFGAGKRGKKTAIMLKRFGCFAGYIDNDINKQKTGVDDSVYSFDEYLGKRDGCIIIGTVGKMAAEIKHQMEERNLCENEDFYYDSFLVDRLFQILLAYCLNTVYIKLAQISLTERCTLKCRKCAHACYNVPRTSTDLTIEEAKDSIDSFFSVVDYIDEFVLIGGEPLLYDGLEEIISYTADKYREKMGVFCITTNGTLMPNDATIELCRKWKVLFRISNYQVSLPYMKEKYEILTKQLEKSGVPFFLYPEDQPWMDYGFDYLRRNASESELIEIFDECRTPCREIRGSKYYFCVMARAVSDNLGLLLGKEDYLDINSLNEADKKKVFMEFELGFSDKGYLDMCDRCYGNEIKNHIIPSAEQVR